MALVLITDKLLNQYSHRIFKAIGDRFNAEVTLIGFTPNGPEGGVHTLFVKDQDKEYNTVLDLIITEKDNQLIVIETNKPLKDK